MRTDKDAATGAGDPPPTPPQPQPRRVRYVINRPYSAGEAFDVVTARVKRQEDGNADVLDLLVPGPNGEEIEVGGVRRADRQEPGTWFEGDKG